MNPRNLQVADATICVFENSSPAPKFGSVTVLPDGPGKIQQVTYGYHQGTDASNTLDKIVEAYVADPAAQYGGVLAGYLGLLRMNTAMSIQKLAGDHSFKTYLARAGDDPVMHRAQVGVFRKHYSDPAQAILEGSGWVSALAFTTILDGLTHGSFNLIRDKVVGIDGEQEWITHYLLAREAWLKAHYPTTACRPQSLLQLAHAGNWDMLTPFTLDLRQRGKVTITEADLVTL